MTRTGNGWQRKFPIYTPRSPTASACTRSKCELEDLSLKYTDRKQYDFHQAEAERDETFARRLHRRVHHPYQKQAGGGWAAVRHQGTHEVHPLHQQQLKKQNIPFEDIYDLFAIRIILDTPYEKERSDCWQVYSIITDMYQPNPKRMKDWISIPKTNGYESLHITVMGPQNKWVEVQIRTERMDEIAERGLAAHWRYKGIKGGESGVDEWLNNIRSALENNDDLQLMDQFKNGSV